MTAKAKPNLPETGRRKSGSAGQDSNDEAGGKEGGMATGSAGGPGEDELEEKTGDTSPD